MVLGVVKAARYSDQTLVAEWVSSCHRGRWAAALAVAEGMGGAWAAAVGRELQRTGHARSAFAVGGVFMLVGGALYGRVEGIIKAKEEESKNEISILF